MRKSDPNSIFIRERRMKVFKLILTGTLIGLFVVSLVGPATAQSGDKPDITVVFPDIASIVRAIGGDEIGSVNILLTPGSDPHAATLTAEMSQAVTDTDLIVYANSEFFTIESDIKAVMDEGATGTASIDWPDYERYGATLKSIPGYDDNHHGYWLDFENAKAIATATAASLGNLGVDSDILQSNLADFIHEINALRDTGTTLVTELDRERTQWVAMVPGVAYTITNLGVGVGAVVATEGSGFASGSELLDIENNLIEGEFTGIVCPLSMKDSRPGEMARQLSEDSGTPVCYIRFFDATPDDSFTSQASYNLGAIANALGQSDRRVKGGGAPVSGTLIWALIVFALLIAVVIQNKRINEAYSGLGSVNKKPKKKK